MVGLPRLRRIEGKTQMFLEVTLHTGVPGISALPLLGNGLDKWHIAGVQIPPAFYVETRCLLGQIKNNLRRRPQGR